MAQESWKLELDQEDTSCQPPEGPFYCANKCGFFGSKATMNMCSKCYRDLVSAQANESSSNGIAETSFASQPGLIEPILLVTRSDQVEPVISKVAEVLKSTVEGNRPARVFVNRCFACDKRVGLTGFKCRCGDFFCSLHRYSDKHNCTFDYKSAGRDAILKANPVVKADKIEKI